MYIPFKASNYPYGVNPPKSLRQADRCESFFRVLSYAILSLSSVKIYEKCQKVRACVETIAFILSQCDNKPDERATKELVRLAMKAHRYVNHNKLVHKFVPGKTEEFLFQLMVFYKKYSKNIKQ